MKTIEFVFFAGMAFSSLLPAVDDIAKLPGTSPRAMIDKYGSFSITDASSYFTFSKDGTFKSGPMGMSGREMTGTWTLAGETKFTVIAKLGWMNGLHPPEEFRRIVFSVAFVRGRSESAVAASGVPKELFEAYCLIEEFIKVPNPEDATNALRVADLFSLSQEVRDAAAKVLKETFAAPPRTRWEPIVAAIKPGATKEGILEHLRPYNVTMEMRADGVQSFTECYRLDNTWLLDCTYRTSDSVPVLIEHKLSDRLRNVWIAPPSDFTGTWTTYFVNGQRSHEIQCVNGRYSGTATAFYPDGAKLYIQHHGPLGADGEEVGFFPSGRVSYRGHRKNGSPVGTWKHYDEEGFVSSSTTYPEP